MSDVASPLVRPAPTTAWAYFVRAPRPAAMWICAVALAVNGVWLPVVTHMPPDWVGITTFGGTLLGLGAMRSYDKSIGAAS